ncbi:hypothetical protein MRB53_035181 [Persea americana]|uniref:Uncharacterized protein n=1 Tax=Persea americana TaxID=3435 RepID=A0ACC2K459_PERAE|nr:hypothetical protein MRB53_035181 [Persea americana]
MPKEPGNRRSFWVLFSGNDVRLWVLRLAAMNAVESVLSSPVRWKFGTSVSGFCSSDDGLRSAVIRILCDFRLQRATTQNQRSIRSFDPLIRLLLRFL